MKLLHVIANNFKNFNDSFEIDFYHDRFIYRYKTIKKRRQYCFQVNFYDAATLQKEML
jgi:hypothetical protein